MTEAAAEESQQPALAHRLEYLAFLTAERLLGLFSIETTVRIGRGLGALVHWASPSLRRLVTRNLRIATAGSPPDSTELRSLVRETFRRAGANLLGSQRTALMTLEQLRSHIEFDGLDHLLGPLRSGRGVVVVWSHMGNWEVLAQLFNILDPGTQGGPIYRPLANPLLDDLVVRRRTRDGAVLFGKQDGFLGPAALLRDGGVVTVMSDQRAGGHGDLCPFFGRLSSCTPLPSLLARRAGAARVTLSISTIGIARWKVAIRPVADTARVEETVSQLESAMRASLTDVFWFHDRWRIDRTKPLCFFTRQSPARAAAAATVPTRFAVTMPASATGAAAMIERILTLRPDVRIDVLDPGDIPPLPEDPRVIRFPWNRGTDTVLDPCDLSHPAPLDFVLLLGGEIPLARAAKRLGLRAILGAGVSGKPWTKTFSLPTDTTGWQGLAEDLVLTAKNRDR